MAFYFGPSGQTKASLAELGLEQYEHVPFILGADFDYLDEANNYLRERAFGIWSPSVGDVSEFGHRKPLSENSLAAYGRDLENFWSYVEIKGIDWRTLTYADLLTSYDKDMALGNWSASGAPLANSTINRRVDRALEFLRWSALRGHRGELKVPTHVIATALGARGRTRLSTGPSEVRAGKRRVHPKHLRLPTIEEVTRWLGEVRVKHGRTRALACEMILETGCRLEEVALIRATQISDPETILPDRPAKLDICYGTKGGRVPGDPEKKGHERTLRFDRRFLIKLNNYKKLGRLKALAAFRKRNPGKPAPQELFLDERTGEPLTKSSRRLVAAAASTFLPDPAIAFSVSSIGRVGTKSCEQS